MNPYSRVVRDCPDQAREFIYEHLCLRDNAGKTRLWQSLIQISNERASRPASLRVLRRIWSAFCSPSPEAFRAFYQESHTPNRRKELRELGLPRISNLLDVGCGDGLVTTLIADEFRLEPGSVWGVDTSFPKWFEERFSAVTVSNGSRYRLPLVGNRFDLVVAFQSLHHMRDPFGCLSEVVRVLTDKGIVVIREHDVTSQTLRRFLYFVDSFFYEVIMNSSVPGFKPKYRSVVEWLALAQRSGLALIKAVHPRRCQVYNSVDLIFKKVSG